MNPTPTGVIGTFLAVASVNTPTRRELSKNTKDTCTHSLQAGNDIMTVKDLMGHDTIETTQIYAHADHARGVSPLDVANTTIAVAYA
jgi:integrase